MNNRFWPAILLAVALLTPAWIAAQESSEVLVRVLDSTDDPIRSATVRLLVGERDEVGPARLTNGSGVIWFRGLAPGEYQVVAERLGYERRHAVITLAAAETARVTLSLPESAVQLDGVAVRVESAGGRERQRFLDETGLSARTVGGDDLKAVPAVGEADVLRVVQTMPGVVSASDFAAAYNVRGGSADQNLILLDGFPLFNPFHLGGLFSVFNSDVVARAELFTGGFSAEYGGRVSSVLDVETRSTLDGDGQVDLGLSLLSSRLAWRSPLPAALATIFGGDTAGVLLSGRRSYLDWVLRPVVSFPYHLSDLQGRVEWETAGDGELSLLIYHERLRLMDGGEQRRRDGTLPYRRLDDRLLDSEPFVGTTQASRYSTGIGLT